MTVLPMSHLCFPRKKKKDTCHRAGARREGGGGRRRVLATFQVKLDYAAAGSERRARNRFKLS